MSQSSRPPLPPDLDPRRPKRGTHRETRRNPPSRADSSPRMGSRPRSPFALVGSWLAVLASVATVVVSVGGYAALSYYSGRVGRIHIHLPGHSSPSADSDGQALNFLLVGSDSRAGKNGSYQAQKGSADYVTGQRSDTVMLAHLPAGREKATLVSFPRDSWVTIPAFTAPDGTTTPAHQAKLNSAFTEGGPALLTQLIENLSGLHVDHYVEIDFEGFKSMVNALGGIDICVQTARHEKESTVDLHKGVNQDVKGDMALAFVRQRYGLPHGDLDRIKDQQYFISQVIHKVESAGTLANPFSLNSFLQALTKAITVDDNLGFSDMKNLALKLRHIDPAHVRFVTVPVASENAWRDQQSVVLLDEPAMHQLFAELKGGPQPSQAPLKATVPPSQVTLQVLNGAGTPGLAARARDDLTSVGFTVSSIGNYQEQGLDHTEVRYAPGHKDEATTVAAAMKGGAQLVERTGQSVDVILVAGQDYSGAQPVSVGGQSSSGPSPSASAKPTPSATPPPKDSAAAMSCAP